MSAVTLTRRLFAVFMASTFLLVGCSSAPSKPPPEIKQIRILPVAPVDRLYTENKGVPVGVLWQAIADRVKSNDFNERMNTTRLALATRLEQALLKELKAQGFEVSTMTGVPRPTGDPDDVDYERLSGSEPVLHVYFSEVGMLSSRFSLDYLPRVNVGAVLVQPGEEDYLYDETIYYGANSSGPDDSGSIPSDPRFKWSSFDALVDKPEVVVESYEAGVDAVARRIADNIRTQTGKPTVSAGDGSTTRVN